ncbi:unnamed protein product [Didymodactylos carnosus]|uniref:Uncharacterized protein n=1 Tax=Didymodactylos carnosus TaxID=1234261 RepID=A0A814Q856_9BILA|nr:unnamed protein product [Didymodactylos carnosus]CAF1291519.1 unnamed protein product [Didymodactylos carnosus]CAF3880204.1 unnamed protein product [Didymodactylos carnosus]CAF4096287.1 unnamed protein product [Didymodactylos carnosus]
MKTSHFDTLSHILKFTPYLEYLNVTAIIFKFDTLLTIHLPRLTQLFIADEKVPPQYGLCRIPTFEFSQITSFIKQFSSTLTRLSLNICHCFVFGENISIGSLTSQMVKLTKFHYYLKIYNYELDYYTNLADPTYIYSVPFLFKQIVASQCNSNIDDSNRIQEIRMNRFTNENKIDLDHLKCVTKLTIIEDNLFKLEIDAINLEQIEEVEIDACHEISRINECLWKIFPQLRVLKLNCGHQAEDDSTAIARVLMNMLNTEQLVSLTFTYVAENSCIIDDPLPTIEPIVKHILTLDNNLQISDKYQLSWDNTDEYVHWWK